MPLAKEDIYSVPAMASAARLMTLSGNTEHCLLRKVLTMEAPDVLINEGNATPLFLCSVTSTQMLLMSALTYSRNVVSCNVISPDF